MSCSFDLLSYKIAPYLVVIKLQKRPIAPRKPSILGTTSFRSDPHKGMKAGEEGG